MVEKCENDYHYHSCSHSKFDAHLSPKFGWRILENKNKRCVMYTVQPLLLYCTYNCILCDFLAHPVLHYLSSLWWTGLEKMYINRGLGNDFSNPQVFSKNVNNRDLHYQRERNY